MAEGLASIHHLPAPRELTEEQKLEEAERAIEYCLRQLGRITLEKGVEG